MSFTLTLQRTAYTDNDTINAAAFNAQSCLAASLADGQSYLFGLGTVGAPSVGFLGDPDTGLYSPGADQLALVTAGVARLTVSAAGLLTVPGTLTVAGILTATAGLTGDVRGGLTATLGTAALPSIDFTGDVDTGLYSTGPDQLGLATAGVARLTIDATGAVTVAGALTASGGLNGSLTTPLGAVTAPSVTFSGDTNTGIYSPGADQLSLVTAGVARLTVASDGSLTVPGLLRQGSGLGAKLHLFGDEYGFGIQPSLLQVYCPTATDRVGIGYGSSAAYTETLSVVGGRIGINKIAPAVAVDVVGSALFTGTLTVNSAASPVGTVRNITISTAAPSGGADGDVWLQYTA